MTSQVIGLFDDMFHAQSAVSDLQREGVPQADISVMANESVTTTDVTPVVTETESGAWAGAGTGAAVGGAAGLALGLAAVALPGIGPVVVAGPLFAALSGALMGAAAGGIIGALVDAGIPEVEAAYYAEGVRRGGLVVTARVAPSFASRATELMRMNGAVDIHDRVSFWRETGWTGYDVKAPAYTSEEAALERARLAARAAALTPSPVDKTAVAAIEDTAGEVARRRAA